MSHVEKMGSIPISPAQSLAPFGWTPAHDGFFQEHLLQGYTPGRVVAASRGLALAQTPFGERWCTPSGRFRERLQTDDLSLCTGDWIALRWSADATQAQIVDLLPRGPSLSRREAGPGGRRQWLATNIDVAFLLMGMDRNFNVGRMERFLALAWGSGARPIIVLTKADLEEQPAAPIAAMKAIAPGVPIFLISSLMGTGLDELRNGLSPGQTGAMIGSSGVGKSTLLNALAGSELRRTQEIRTKDGRGRHTTSLRELFLLPGLGCLIDTPGLREVGLSTEAADLEGAFTEVADFAQLCRFRDCTHESEPGCAVRQAIEEGRLDPRRHAHYLRLARELEYETARSDQRLWREREQKWRRIHKSMKQLKNH